MVAARKQILGVCYYPEHWPDERWDEDARMMADAGIAPRDITAVACIR